MSGLSGSCCPAKCSTPVLAPVKAGTGTDGIFTSGVASPLDDQTHYRGNLLLPLPGECK